MKGDAKHMKNYNTCGFCEQMGMQELFGFFGLEQLGFRVQLKSRHLDAV